MAKKSDVKKISLEGLDRFGVDSRQRLYWDGKPVEIRQRLDLTTTQIVIALLVAIFTLIAAAAACVQAWTSYHDFACKAHWRVFAACPPEPLLRIFE